MLDHTYMTLTIVMRIKYEKTQIATATEYLSDTRFSSSSSQSYVSLKTRFPALFNSHVTSHVIHKINE